MGHNASHYFYVKNKNDDFGWTNDLHSKKIIDLLGNERLDENTEINDKKYFQFLNIPSVDAEKESFELKVQYPGLLTGSGYSHLAFAPKEDPDYQLGFFFDHTLGIPIIPGSSVKGVIKSVFPKAGSVNMEEMLNEINKRVGYVNKKNPPVITEDNWEKIFFKKGNVFFDAYPVSVESGNTLFEEDTITPHGKDLFKNPVPLRFIKVPAGVTFKFQFLITAYKDDESEMKKSAILKVFKKILQEYGICAKRNVGYGHFER